MCPIVALRSRSARPSAQTYEECSKWNILNYSPFLGVAQGVDYNRIARNDNSVTFSCAPWGFYIAVNRGQQGGVLKRMKNDYFMCIFYCLNPFPQLLG